MSRPPFIYFGGKANIAGEIAGNLPPHRQYVEPYAGSLAVLLAKKPAPFETVNDLDGDLMTFWRTLRDRPADLQRVCMLTPHSRAELAAAYAPCDDQLEQARRLWVRLTQGRGGLTSRRTGWSHFTDPGTSASMPDSLAAYVGRMAPIARRLASVSLESMPALDLIAKYGQHADTLIYADPPYLGSLRKQGNNYTVEMRTETEHAELLEALTGCRAAVVLSGYASPLYDDALTGWHRRAIITNTGNGSSGSRARTEILWSNRPFPQGSLFDA